MTPKTKHDGDCSIYESLGPTASEKAGICNCGFGEWQEREAMLSMYSPEFLAALKPEGK